MKSVNCMLAVNLTVASLISTRVSLSPIFNNKLTLTNSKFSHFFAPVLIQIPSLHAKDVLYSSSAAPFLLSTDKTWYEYRLSQYTNENRFEDITQLENEYYYKFDGCIFQGITGTTCLKVNAPNSRLQIRCSSFSGCGAQLMNAQCKEIYLEQVFASGSTYEDYLFDLMPTRLCKVQQNSWIGTQAQKCFVKVQERQLSLQNSNATSVTLTSSGMKVLGIGVRLCTFASITGTDQVLFDSQSTIIDTCNFIQVGSWIFNGNEMKPTLMKSYFSESVHLLKRYETPVGWEDPLIPIECVFVEPVSQLFGVDEGGSSRYGVGSASPVEIGLQKQYICVPDRTSFIPSPSRSDLPPATPNPLMPTPTQSRSPVATISPSQSQSPSPSQSPEATPDVPKILTITIPSGIAIIVIPIFLYFCIRMIQDAVSAGDYHHGEVLTYVSDESAESGDRENAMWMNDDDSDFADVDEKDFFKSKVIRNPRDVFNSEQSDDKDDDSSGFL